ncbi:MAG: arylesterase, partial [Pseudomonadota bacterium]
MTAPVLIPRAIIAVMAAIVVAFAATSRADAEAPAAGVLVVGDSLSAAYGLEAVESGWVALLEERLSAKGQPMRVTNASISGDTTAGGRARLPAALARHAPAVVIIELGGNDGLRGIDLASTRANLSAMLSATRAADAEPVLLGMMIPPNYGQRYTDAFIALFAELAEEYDAAFEPFFLADVALDANFMQSDG